MINYFILEKTYLHFCLQLEQFDDFSCELKKKRIKERNK